MAEDLAFSGKVVIVTGAASGIGLATTKLFLAQGARVVAEDINPEIDKQFAGVANLATLVGDVSKEETAVEAVPARSGQIRPTRCSHQQRRSYCLQACNRDVAGGLELDYGRDIYGSLPALPRSTESHDTAQERSDC